MRINFLWVVLAMVSCTTPEKKATENLSPLPDKKKTAVVIEAQSGPDSLKGSLQAVAEGTIGDAAIRMEYYSPAVRGRILWGGLVPWDQVWVTGAHNCTRITFEKDMEVGGRAVMAGTYAFFSIPGKEEWMLILNKNYRQHLADQYAASEDVVRVSAKPMAAPHQERLRYQVIAAGERSGFIAVHWEQLAVQLPLTVAGSK